MTYHTAPPGTSGPGTYVRVNFRLLIILGVLLATLVAGSAWMRSFWMDRNAEVLMRRAESLQEENKLGSAVLEMQHYLRLRPRDANAVVKLANWVESGVPSADTLPPTHEILQDFLNREPLRKDVRRHCVRLAIQMDRFQEVLTEHLPYLRAELPLDSELLGWVIECYAATQDWESAVNVYLDALSQSPERAEYYAALASIIEKNATRIQNLQAVRDQFGAERSEIIDVPGTAAGFGPSLVAGARDRLDDIQTADHVVRMILDAMLRRSESRMDARLARAGYLLRTGDLEGADIELKFAGEIASDHPDFIVLSLEAEAMRRELALVRGEPMTAQAAVERSAVLVEAARKQSPVDWRVLLIEGRQQLQTGKTSEAVLTLRDAVAAADVVVAARRDRNDPVGESAAIMFRANWALANGLLAELPAAGVERRDAILLEVDEIVQRFKESYVRGELIEFLKAQRVLYRGNWSQAAESLEHVRGDLVEYREAVRVVDEGLVRCYSHLENTDGVIRTYRRALDDDPLWHSGRVRLAELLESLNRYDDALIEYRKVNDAVSIPVPLLRLALREQLRLPPGQRKWTAIETRLAELEQEPQHRTAAISLRGEVLLAQGDTGAAESSLLAAISTSPFNRDLAAQLISTVLRRTDLPDPEKCDRADQLLTRLVELGLGEVDRRVLRGRIAVSRGGADGEAALRELASGLEQLTPAQKRELLGGLALLAEEAELPELGLELWQEVLTIPLEDAAPLIRAAELAARLERPELFDELLARLRQFEGKRSYNAGFLSAMSLLLTHRRELARARSDGAEPGAGAPARLQQAESELKSILAQRPSWSAAHRLMGQVLLELGRSDRAYDHFREAFRNGDRSRETILHIVGYLVRQNRDGEVLEIVRQVEDESPALLSPEVSRAGLIAALREQQWDVALSRSTELGSTNSADKLIRAYVLMARGENLEQTDRLLREVTRESPEQPHVWSMRVEFLVRQQRLDEARQVIREAESGVPAEPAWLRPLTLALCLEQIGDIVEADQQFEAAHGRQSALQRPLNEHVGFCLRHGRSVTARELVRLLLEPDSNLTAGEREEMAHLFAELSAMTAESGGDLTEAFKILGMAEDLQALAVDDLRSMAQILALSRLQRDELRLIEVVEELDRRAAASPLMMAYLAQLYFENGRRGDAFRQFQRAIDADQSNTMILAAFIAAGVTQGTEPATLVKELESAVEQLENLEPRGFRSSLARAQLLALQRRGDEAVPLLDGLLKRLDEVEPPDLFQELLLLGRAEPVLQMLERRVEAADPEIRKDATEQLRRLASRVDDATITPLIVLYLRSPEISGRMREEMTSVIAEKFETLQKYSDAERVLKQSFESSPRPDRAFALAAFYARRGRVAEALAVCDRSGAGSVAWARAAVAVLRAARASAEASAGVERRLLHLQAQAASPAEAGALQTILADLYGYLGRDRDSIKVYEDLLAKEGSNVVALNNLAWLRAFDSNIERRRAALDLVEKAIAIAGPAAGLLDTRGLIQLSLNHPERAQADFSRALDDTADPTYWVHLAVAQVRQGDYAGARKSWQQAESLGFAPRQLQPLELPLWEELKRGLKLESPDSVQ